MDKDLVFLQTILSDEMVADGFPSFIKANSTMKLKLFTSMAEAKVSKGCPTFR
jgi:hypothetical protein